MKGLWTAILLLLIYAPLASAQASEMLIRVDENAAAHITISIENPPNIAELRTIVTEPRVHEIYREQLSSVFGSVENLDLSVDSGVFVVEFDSPIGSESNGRRVIERIDFNGKIDAVSTLDIALPQETVFVDSEPAPDKISENLLEWHDVDFIPQVRYKKLDALPRNWLAAVVIVLLILAVGYFIWKKRR